MKEVIMEYILFCVALIGAMLCLWIMLNLFYSDKSSMVQMVNAFLEGLM